MGVGVAFARRELIALLVRRERMSSLFAARGAKISSKGDFVDENAAQKVQPGVSCVRVMGKA
jgi:hypothetical protein